MSYVIQTGKDFDVRFKKLSKRYRSLPDDYEDFLDLLEKNPYQGAELSPGIRKIHKAITSKGSSESGCSLAFHPSVAACKIQI